MRPESSHLSWSAMTAYATVAVALVALPACRSHVVREVPYVRVEAPDAASAEQWLAEAAAARTRILADLAALAPADAGQTGDARPIRIRASDGNRWNDVILGTADKRRRVVRLRGDSPDRDIALAHEIAHLCLGTDWVVLPAAVEEGLVDLLGARAIDALPRIRAQRAEGLMWAFGGLALRVTWRLPGASAETLGGQAELEWRPPGGAAALDPAGSPIELLERRDHFAPETIDPTLDPFCYGVGYVLVERVVARAGLGGLRAACVEASASAAEHVAVPRLFELGGVAAPATDVDFGTLARWLAEVWDEPTQRAWLAWRAERLAPFLAAALRWGEQVSEQHSLAERQALLERADVRISVTWTGLAAEEVAPVSLRDVPALTVLLTGRVEQ